VRYPPRRPRWSATRCQPVSFDRIPIQEHLEDRILSDTRGVVAVHVDAGHSANPLPDKLRQLVADLALFPEFGQAARG